MDIRKLQRLVVDALEDVKATDIKVFNSTGLTQLFDRVIIASGTSNRQTRALAASVRDKVKGAGGHIVSIEGEETGEWVLVDLGDAIVHVMQPAIRAYYNLEEIWGGKTVSMKSLDAVESDVLRSAASRRAADTDPERATVARQSAARKAVPRKTSASGASAKTVIAGPARKATTKPVGKPSVKKAVEAAAKAAAAGRATVTKVAAKKAAAPRKTLAPH